jgi:GH15 family glucan-1,4-alpha-glucosidase
MTPDSKVVDVYTPKIPTQKPHKSLATPFSLNASEQDFLYAWMRNGADNYHALLEAGYHPADARSARDMANQILRKIDRACEVGDVFELSGHGATAWVERILSLAYSDNLKARSVAVRLWGLAAQYFTPSHGAQGASINVSIDARKPLPPAYPDEP